MTLQLVALGLITFTLTTSTALAAGKKPSPPPLNTAESVDLSRYIGKWYEIARLPQWFEKDCVGVTAEYSLRSDGRVNVINTCRKNSCEGKIKTAHGIARVVDTTTHAKLKVSFFWPFEGDYWILDLEPNYQVAVVGSPDRKTFWILSRTPTLPFLSIQNIIDRFVNEGFDLSGLVKTQSCE